MATVKYTQEFPLSFQNLRKEKEPEVYKVVSEEKSSNLHLPPSLERRHEHTNDIEIFKRTEKEGKKP